MDNSPLFEINSVDNIVKYLFDCGVKTIVIKSVEEGGYWIYHENEAKFIEFYETQIVPGITPAFREKSGEY